jgi:hypothetical protein
MTEGNGQGPDQGFDSQGQADQNDSGQSGTGINPAWNDVLSIVPEQLQPQITPHLQKWDQNYQESLNKVHSQYEGWKPFIDGGVEPSDVDFALGLLNAISTNPQEVQAALNEWLESEEGGEGQEYEDEQGQFNSAEQTDPYDITQHPAYQEMEQAVQTMAQILLGQREEEQQAQADEELDQELKTLEETYGEFDVRYVLGLAMNDESLSLEDAVKEYVSLQEGILSGKRKPGPPVLGSGGSSPNSDLNPAKMSSTDTKALVAQMLQNSLGQG